MTQPGGHVAPETVEVTSVHDNVAQEVVRITVDRLKLVLSQHLEDLEARRQWIAPLGIVLTLLITFATTTFKEFVFPAATWEAFFMMATLLCSVWFVRTAYRSWRAGSVDDVVERLKKST
jgi:hypothetical protein